MTSQSKILVVISTPEYYRNYISSPALDRIKSRCVFVVHEKLMSKGFPGIKKEQLIPYCYPERHKSWHRHFFYVNAWRNRHKSSSFAFRFELYPDKRHRKFFYKLASLPVIFNLIKFFVLRVTRDKNLEEIISKINPRIILLPSSGYDGLTFEIIGIAQKNKIPACMLVDNWDNLTSKTVFTRKPDYLVVWGKQSVEAAVRIHGMARDRVFPLGTPRFVEYFDSRNLLPSPYKFKYILFAGIAAPFDELTTLKKLEGIIERNGLDIKIVYRPHPWRKHRKCADTFFEYDFKHVVLDEQSKLYYKRDEDDEFNDIYMPDLSYYPKLLTNMEFMICPLSTMIIEGLLFGKKVFVPVYDDGVHPTSPKNLLVRHEHFKGIEKFKNLYLVENIEYLDKIFDRSFCTTNDAAKTKNADVFDFISPDTSSYPVELEKLVNLIISKNANA